MSLADSEDESPAKNKRKRAGPAAARAKAPVKTPAAKKAATNSASAKGASANLPLVTPAAASRSSATANGNRNSSSSSSSGPHPASALSDNIFGLCHAGADTPMAGSTPASHNKPPLILAEGVQAMGQHDHDQFAWMQLGQRKDKAGRLHGQHPEANPRTLFVPPTVLKEQTPAMAQWWKFKADNLDTVLFFKVGKFYELFHMDADIGFKELDLIYMKGSKAHSGFPEVSYGKFSAQLVAKGYRVARVEQTETPEMLKDRNAGSKGPNDKVVAREMCCVMSKGTRTYCHLDDLTTLLESEGTDGASADSGASSILLCIKEGPAPASASGSEPESGSEAVVEFGLCSVDTILGTVLLAQFADDRNRTRLRAFLAKYTPQEVLLERSVSGSGSGDEQGVPSGAGAGWALGLGSSLGLPATSESTCGAVRLMAGPRCKIDLLMPGAEMLSAEKVCAVVSQGGYFSSSADVGAKGSSSEGGAASYPPVLRAVVDCLSSGATRLMLEAFGGCVWQLQRSLIDHEILSMGKFYGYVPPDLDCSGEVEHGSGEGVTGSNGNGNGVAGKGPEDLQSLLARQQPLGNNACSGLEGEGLEGNAPDCAGAGAGAVGAGSGATGALTMTLDAVSLANLEILYNNFDRTEKGSLWAYMNRTKTPFGRRLLREWIVRPLVRPRDIARRAAAVQELLGPLAIEANLVRQQLKGMPDLERLLARVHSNGIKGKRGGALFGGVHPDNRAIMYEQSVYNTRKIRDFADVLGGFEKLLGAVGIFNKAGSGSGSGSSGGEGGGVSVSSLLLRRAVKPPGAGAGAGTGAGAFSGASGDSATGGSFPAAKLQQLLKHFREVFDEKRAKQDGSIKPRPGVSKEYDAATANMSAIMGELEGYLREQKAAIGVSDLKFWGSGKDRYQIEVSSEGCTGGCARGCVLPSHFLTPNPSSPPLPSPSPSLHY